MELCSFSLKVHHEDPKPNVIVPYADTEGTTSTFDSVKLNLANQGIVPRLVKLERTYSYDQLFRELWAKQEPFILVEHDILPWPGALKALWTCQEPWCGFPYFVFGELRSYLGCTKFDPVRLGDCPLPEDLESWQTMDKRIEKILMKRGEKGHLHSPAVTHLNFFHSRSTSSNSFSGVHPRFWEAETA